MRASISKPTPFIYLAFEKTDPLIYLIIQNVDLFINCPLIFFVPIFAGCYTNITVNSCNTKRISSLEKSLSEKYVHIPGCQKKWGPHRESRKTGPFIYFLLKKGNQSYTWQCWKRGLFGTHVRNMPYIGSYPRPRAFKARCRPVTKDKLSLGWRDRAMMLLKYLPLLTSNKSSTVKIIFTMKSGRND